MHFIEAKGLLSAKNGMNIYRGCTHGCIYCDSRSACYQMQHPFEDIEVKQNAPELLENALRRKRKKCMIGTGSMSDPYLHCEKTLGLTRQCLEVIEKYRFGVSILTKSDRILRDLDLLKKIHTNAKCVVQMTLTTYDETLCKILEPNVSTTKERFEALKRFRDEGIPTIVWLSPVLPFLNDTQENLRGILEYCKAANVKGILCFGMGTTMREGSREYFYKMLDKFFPGIKQKYQNHYGTAYECTSGKNEELLKIFHAECKKQGMLHHVGQIFSYLQDFPDNDDQIPLL